MGEGFNGLNFMLLLLLAEVICIAVVRLLEHGLSRRKNYDQGKLRYILFSRVVHILTWILPIALLLTAPVCGIASVVYKPQDTGETYTYIHTETEKQSDPILLFETEPRENRTETEYPSPQDVLHIPEFYLGKDVTLEGVQYFETVLGSIYRQGNQRQYEQVALPPDAIYNVWENQYIEEAKLYRGAYEKHPSRKNHYQYARALTDAGMTFDSAPFPHKLAMMNDSVTALEELAVYQEWNANTEEKPSLINTCFLAFSNGKLFLHNAPLAAGSEEGKKYVSWFYVEAYVCFCRGKELIEEQGEEDENKLYALLCYYVGDAGESLLARIDKDVEPTLYNQVYSKALESYQEAEIRYENNPSGYKKEPGIITRIENGINTLEGMDAPNA